MNRAFKILLFVVAFLACNIVSVDAAWATESTIPYAELHKYQAVERDFAHFSTAFYRHLAVQRQSDDYRSFDLIVAEARHAYDNHKPAYAISQILGHEHLLKASINSKAIIETEALLLKANEINTAARLLTTIKNESDPSIIANVQYAFAEYYYARDQWTKTIATVNQIANDLPPREYQHAMLMQGVALQNLRKHRKALIVYKKIPKSSPDYTAARINMAVANIRQGWWTDAYEILTQLLKRADVQKNKNLTDRIHTVIGYTFLQQDYFRNSRNAFRKVKLKGPYTNQALLGIALDAGYQKDYIGALNAARILKNKQSHELQVDEANLLLPYFYEKLGQMATASAGYSDAIKYYEERLRSLNLTINTLPKNFEPYHLQAKTILNINQERIDLGESLPAAFFTQLSLLRIYHDDVEKIGAPSLKQRYKKLLNEFNNLMYTVAQDELKKKVQYLTDYMNQSRYGQARLYDKNLSDAK